MFYRPNYCCDCGAKIERAEWTLTASRRFCDACSAEKNWHEQLPRMIVAAGVLVGVFGFGTWLASSQPSEITRPLTPITAAGMIEKPVVRAIGERAEALPPAPSAGLLQPAEPAAVPDAAQLRTLASAPKERTAPGKISSQQPVYYCGAMTKSGRPCSRRVKSKGRCWQHAGQPSMTEMAVPDEVN